MQPGSAHGLRCADRVLTLDRPRVMGILNVTPDSFSDGGRFLHAEAALRQAERMLDEGADLIDVGGESTRPGSAGVELEDERARVLPVIEAIDARFDTVISVDTSKPELMRDAVAAGAGMVNDVFALRHPGALEAVAELGVPVCLMHMQGVPRTMQESPHYDDLLAEVDGFFVDRIAACEQAGIARSCLLIDPGFGFGKLLAHNLELLNHLAKLLHHGLPVVAGFSRKRSIGDLTGAIGDDRVYGSVAAALIAVQHGASVVRVHDVGATVAALKVWEATHTAGGASELGSS